jgi:hypothetical protein
MDPHSVSMLAGPNTIQRGHLRRSTEPANRDQAFASLCCENQVKKPAGFNKLSSSAS